MRFLLFAFLLLSSLMGNAQNGEFNLQFNDFSIDPATDQFCFDVEIKANSPATEFNLADQNFRFSFNRAAFLESSLTIQQELTLSQFTNDNGVISFYDVHTTTGSLDTVASYNIPLAGGVGYYLNSTDWIKVGKLCLTIVDYNQIGTLDYHCESQFPNVVIIGKETNATLYPATMNSCADAAVNLTALLPVEYLFFKGHLKTDKTVDLSWATASESDTDNYIVERSQDGDHFGRIGTVAAAGNSISQKNYQFIDEQPQNGINYYRIKQVDLDGSYTYTKVVVVDLDKNFFLAVFPNPVKGELTLNVVGDQNEKIEVLISNMLGQQVFQQTYATNFSTDFLMKLDVSSLESGQYIISVKNGISAKHRAITIQR